MKYSGNIRDWIAFIKVVELGSFSAAANALNYSVPTISKSIQRLEDGLKTTLLNRDTRQLELTESGSLAYSRAGHIVELLNGLITDLRNPQKSIEGAIKFTAPALVCEFLANGWVQEYIESYPEVQVFLESRESSQFSKDSSAFDHIVLKSGIIDAPELIHKELSPVQLSLCATKQYLSQYPELNHPQQLKNHNIFKLHHNGIANDVALRRGEEVYQFKSYENSRFSTDNLLATFNLMLENKGICLVTPGFFDKVAAQHPDVKAVLSDWKIDPLPVYLVWRQRRFYSPLFRDFIDFIADKWQSRVPN